MVDFFAVTIQAASKGCAAKGAMVKTLYVVLSLENV